jgi:hypothetical protein
VIERAYFTRFWTPHYTYLEASHYNAGISGDGEGFLFRAQDRLEGRCVESVNSEDCKLEDGFGGLRLEVEKLEELSDFLKICIDEGVEALVFC